MVYKDLIAQLQRVKSERDINEELVDELMNSAIEAGIQLAMKKDVKCSYDEAIDIARMVMLKHFDMVILDANTEEEEN